MKYPEEVMIRKLQAGDESACKEIFNEYYLPLCVYANAFVKDEEVVKDFVQDAFVSYWDRRSQFGVLVAIKSYLYLSVKNACLDWLKHESVVRRNEREVAEYFLSGDDEALMLENEVHEALYRALRDLPEQSRRIVLMTMHGASNQEIARQLNISQNTVKSLKLRSYRVLREKLGGMYGFLAFLLL